MLDENDVRVVEGIIFKHVTPMQDKIYDAIEKQAQKSEQAIVNAASAVATAATVAATAVATAAAAAAAAVVQHDNTCKAKTDVERIKLTLENAKGVMAGVRWTTAKIVAVIIGIATVGAGVSAIIERIANTAK